MWTVFNNTGDAIANTDDLYEAEQMAKLVNGRIELKEDFYK